jgi:hypothetical protein
MNLATLEMTDKVRKLMTYLCFAGMVYLIWQAIAPTSPPAGGAKVTQSTPAK